MLKLEEICVSNASRLALHDEKVPKRLTPNCDVHEPDLNKKKSCKTVLRMKCYQR